MRRARVYINGRKSVANRDVVRGTATNTNQNLPSNLTSHTANTPNRDTDYRIEVDTAFPRTVVVRHPNSVKVAGRPDRKSREVELSEELIDSSDDNSDDNSDDMTNLSIDIDYLTDRNTETEPSVNTVQGKEAMDAVDRSVRAEIDSFLIGLENRYTDHTAYKMWNRMYTIGLDIAISSYSKKKVKKIIENSIRESMSELGADTLDDIKVYNKKKVIEYIQAGIEDGISHDYSDIYLRVLSGKSLVAQNRKTQVSAHLGTMFSKYDDSAHPLDIEQFYNVGIMIANRPFDRERMIEKLKGLIEERSRDEVIAIQRNKRSQLLESMNLGFQDSLNDRVRNAYDLNGRYNYDNRERLRKRARIDGLLARNKKR